MKTLLAQFDNNVQTLMEDYDDCLPDNNAVERMRNALVKAKVTSLGELVHFYDQLDMEWQNEFGYVLLTVKYDTTRTPDHINYCLNFGPLRLSQRTPYTPAALSFLLNFLKTGQLFPPLKLT